MKERLKNDFPMWIGFLVAMCVIDVISNESFDLKQMLLRIIVTIVVYFVFRFVEFKIKKD